MLGGFLVSAKARESGKDAVDGIEDTLLRGACQELLKGKPGTCVKEALGKVGTKGESNLWVTFCGALAQRGKAAQQKKLADDLRLRLAQQDTEGALDAARKLCESLSSEGPKGTGSVE